MNYMFTAKWCSNCEVMKPIVKNMDIQIIDIEDNPEYIDKFQIMSLPTFGKEGSDEFKVLCGIQDKKSLEDFYNVE